MLASIRDVQHFAGTLRSHDASVGLAEHPRFRMHFTPVHCSWMNQLEQWFRVFRVTA